MRIPILSTIICIVILLLPLAAQEGSPVFVRKALSVEKNFSLEFYGRFVYEKKTTLNPPIVSIIKEMNVSLGDRVKKKQLLFTLVRDEPGFTRQERKIRAPFQGIVQGIFNYPGARVTPQGSLMTIASFNPAYLHARVPEEDLNKIPLNAQVTIRVAYLEEPVTGTVVQRLDVDPVKAMARIKIKVDNPAGEIVSGSEGKANYTHVKEKVVIIPAEAVIVEKGRYFVWVHQSGKAEKKEIGLGKLVEEGFECFSGINAGEEIIYYGYLDLKPGDPVKIMESGDES